DRFRRLAASYRAGWRPDLRRLEAIDDVAVMTPTDSREAWASTLLLLHGPGREALVAHLRRRPTHPAASPALSELLRDDLARLNRQFLARVAPSASPDARALTRLQSPTPPSRPPERGRAVIVQPAPAPRGPIGRLRSGIRDLLGLSPS